MGAPELPPRRRRCSPAARRDGPTELCPSPPRRCPALPASAERRCRAALGIPEGPSYRSYLSTAFCSSLHCPTPAHKRERAAVTGRLREQVWDLVIPKTPWEGPAHAERVAAHSGLCARLPEHCPPLPLFQNGHSLSSSIRFAERWVSQLRPISPDTNFACNVHFPLLLPPQLGSPGVLPAPSCFTQLSLAAGQGGPKAGTPGPSAAARAGATSLFTGSREPSLEQLFQQLGAFELAPQASAG